MKEMKAKPFLKWAGGKGRILNLLEEFLPDMFSEDKEITYVEPFIGGGAFMFHMLQTFPQIRKVVVNDLNTDLINCYKDVRNEPYGLMNLLKSMQEEFYGIDTEGEREEYYLSRREEFNRGKMTTLEKSALLIFLNKTCFNGLYRVSSKGKFNVPFGSYDKPVICDRDTILADSDLLFRVQLMSGDFEKTIEKAEGRCFFYLDPPYRPMGETSSFTSYTKEGFNDSDQVRLRKFCDMLDKRGIKFMLSNSNYMGQEFFRDLYIGYRLRDIDAPRSIRPSSGRTVKELIITNY